MGIISRYIEIIISRLIIYLLVTACCDIKLITCDIHQMIQRHDTTTLGSNNSSNVDFRINATELEQHIMSGLNMKRKPDVDLVSVLMSFKKYKSFILTLRVLFTHKLALESEYNEAQKKIYENFMRTKKKMYFYFW